jgi:hypothetical protein
MYFMYITELMKMTTFHLPIAVSYSGSYSTQVPAARLEPPSSTDTVLILTFFDGLAHAEIRSVLVSSTVEV